MVMNLVKIVGYLLLLVLALPILVLLIGLFAVVAFIHWIQGKPIVIKKSDIVIGHIRYFKFTKA
jgi:hypothetical protein